MTKRSVLYARVSGDDRDKDGRNLQGQLDMCRKYALDRGWAIVAELAEDDRGARGADWDLPMLNKALKMARTGAFDVLVVRELDRFARSLAKQLVIEAEFKHAGVEVEYVLGEYPDTPEGNLNKQIRAVIAEYEAQKITERMVRGRRLKVEAGSVLVANRPPYGYQVNKQGTQLELETDEPEARIVRLIYKWYIQGDGTNGPLSISGITRKLSEMRVPSAADTHRRPKARKKEQEPGKWRRASVHRILSSETYCGVWHYGKNKVVGGKKEARPRENWIAVPVPAIVDRKTWERVQAKLKANRKEALGRARHQYLLGRRITCKQCGCKMAGSSSSKATWLQTYYRCTSSSRNRLYGEKCTAPLFPAGLVDQLAWEWIKSWLLDDEQLSTGLERYMKSREQETAPLCQELDVVQALLEKNRAELERLLDLYLEGGLLKEALLDRKKRYELVIDSLQDRFSELAALIDAATFTQEQMETIRTFAAQVREKLGYADDDFEAKRRVIEMLDVRAELAFEDGEKVAYVSCGLGYTKSCMLSNTTPDNGHHTSIPTFAFIKRIIVTPRKSTSE